MTKGIIFVDIHSVINKFVMSQYAFYIIEILEILPGFKPPTVFLVLIITYNTNFYMQKSKLKFVSISHGKH